MAAEKQEEQKASMPFWRDGIKAIDDLVQNVKATSTGNGIATKSGMTIADKRVVRVPIDKVAIKKGAEEIASWKNPYDVAIWLFAEAETRLADAYVSVLDGTSPSVDIDAGKVVENPPRDATESLAKAIYAKRPKLSEIHWFLSERRYIYEKLKAIS